MSSQSLHLKSQSKIFKCHLLYVAFSGSSPADCEGHRLFLPGNFMAISFFLHFCCCTFHFLSCISSYSCAHLSAPLDSKNPRKSDKPHVVAIKWLNFGPKLNWDFSFFFEASFGWCRFLSACYSISAHGPNDVGEVS